MSDNNPVDTELKDDSFICGVVEGKIIVSLL